MVKKSTQAQDYKQLSAELTIVMAELEQGDLDIDEAVSRYERGMEVIKLLEAHLKQAENRVTKLKASLAADEEE